MPKQYSIKWRGIDLEKVRRAVTNFNKRIDYWAKKSPEIAESLPQKLSYKAVKEAIRTRKDFNREISQIEKFNPGKLKKSDFIEIAPGTTVTKWEYKRTSKQLEKVNALREEAAQRAKMRQVSVNGVQYKAVEEAHAEQKGRPVGMYKPDTSRKTEPRQEWKQFVKWVEGHAAPNKYKDAQNHKEALLSVLEGDKHGFNDAQKKLLIRLLNQVDANKLLDAYYKGKEEVDPDYIYNDPEDSWKKFDKMKKYLQQFLPEKLRALKEELKNAIRGHSVFKQGQKNYLIGLLNKITEDRLEAAADSGAPEADPAFVDMAATFDFLKERYQAMI